MLIAFCRTGRQESLGDKIEALPDVDVVAPTVILTEPKNLIMIYGIVYTRFNALSRGFLYRAGRALRAPDVALADDIIAQSKHLKVGDHIALLNHGFVISGIVAHGKGARFFVPLRTAPEIAGSENRASMFYVRSTGETEKARAEALELNPDKRV